MKKRWSDTDGTSWHRVDVFIMGVVKASSCEEIIGGRVSSYTW